MPHGPRHGKPRVTKNLEFEAPIEAAGERLDRFLSQRITDASRSRIQQWIRDGRVLVDDLAGRASTKLRGGEVVEVDPAPATPLRAEPEDIPLEILYEDEHLVAVNKPAGMVVHAGAGEASRSGTLVNAALHHFGKSLSKVGGELRPGIVHRLDRWTSGVILVAKSDRAHAGLADAFEARQVNKTYLALCQGEVEDPKKAVPPRKGRAVEADGRWWVRIEAPIGRDPRHRHRMAVVESGRAAVTDYRPLATVSRPAYSLLEVRIHTGRTHQIRVHLSWAGRAIVGDTMYGASARPLGLEPIERFYLHAWKLDLRHPVTDEPLRLEAPLPDEFVAALGALGLPEP